MSTGDQTAIIGGNGDDVIRADAATINGGSGDDDIYAETGTVLGGNGNDAVILTAGTAEGGDGDDSLTGGGNGQTVLFGQAGNDRLSIRGTASEAHGGIGDDFIGVENDALGFGGDGNDTLQLSSGATGSGGDGDDLITVWNRLGDEDGPATATGGAGSDTFDVLVRNALNGEADDIFLHITDFDVTEDVLQVDAWELSSEVSDVEIIEADDGTYTDVRVTFTGIPALGPGIAIIRLDGTPGITADNVVINM
jgi:Ca2+-binding RTX toxin-like protein